MSTITTEDETQIYFKDWGPKQAQPLVFHHGWPLSADDWDNQMLFFAAQGFRVILDASADKLGAKIRNARLMRHPYIAVIGDEEAASTTLSVRSRDAGELGKLSLTEFAARLSEESKPPKVAN